MPASREENVRTYDGRKVRKVHLASSIIRAVRERCNPFEENEKNLQCVSVTFGQYERQHMEKPLAVVVILQTYNWT